MQKINGLIHYSASDVVNFLDCESLTTLDRINLETPLPQAEDDEEALLYQRKGLAHEEAYVTQLRKNGTRFADISEHRDNLEAAVGETLAAMHAGVDIVYQAALEDGRFIGHADFLRRVPRPSALGDFSYEVVDTKLSRSTKARYLIQLCFYSELVAAIQGRDPLRMHVVLGDRREESFRYADYARYYSSLKRRFLAGVEGGGEETYPEPCERCDICRWRNLCEERRLKDDHLCQVAGITKVQIRKLAAQGVTTLEALAKWPETDRIPKMAPETLAKIRHQARLQLTKRQTGKDIVELLPHDPAGKRGFFRLPKPDAGDLFFDMEGDPLEEGSLEYLFGIHYFNGGQPRFQSFWAHTRDEERQAFKKFMDFVAGRLTRYPHAHIYHYAHYEETALKRLMSLHGTQESQVDNLLRFGKLIDLYKVVREALRVSEPSYSIKNIERFYMPPRTGPVTDAGASIVSYERWKETGNQNLLTEIETYNRDDLQSTFELRRWLLTLRPDLLPWAGAPDKGATTPPKEIGLLNPDEERLVRYRELLFDPLPKNRDEWKPEDRLRELTFQLLDFHRRAAKPAWWGLFSRREMSAEELTEDAEAIGGMKRLPEGTTRDRRGTLSCLYAYPEQETKLKTGDACVRTDTIEKIGAVTIDEEERRVALSWPSRYGPPPDALNIGPEGPLQTKLLQEALFRFADDLLRKEKRYRALRMLLGQEAPHITGCRPGADIIDESRDPFPQIIEAIANMDHSHLFIQGPPGAGKTWTGAHVIKELLHRGFKIGVSSNSHKAINNLLRNIEAAARKRKIRFRGVKKSVEMNQDSLLDGEMIADVFRNDEIYGEDWQLVAGTAWLFSAEPMDETLDYLFVDEAGQVAMANLVAMGTCARNIVLLGDQMQLGQPIQGVHPGRSGESTLDYLLNGLATIPSERGIFLKTTWRMHEDVCRFISDAVYDGRLEAEAANNRQRLVLRRDVHPLLKPTGIRYVPVAHEGCSQKSEEEAAIVLDLYRDLLKQRFIDRNGVSHAMTAENILIVAPYNMQVNLLHRILPQGARVGTVDKFQGQEAEAVIISMATSSGEDLPRHIEFLYSKNRLNVAISRARCLAILVANPALMAIRCTTPEQMALVNTLCWVREYGGRSPASR
ncbi:MAG: nuclease [Deltaproteobacteria bacterium RBG_16_58_17]|nr:MAG: nuclease [Deltaproteobacteria bacterium RBG_16_58_17]